MPILSHENLFTHLTNNSFCVWGGSKAFGDPPNFANLWRFTADGVGGGEWVREVLGNPEFFSELEPVDNGVVANSANAGFLFGGQTLNDGIGENAKSMMTFEFGSKKWS